MTERFAQLDVTERHFRDPKYANLPSHRFGRTGLTVSAVAFGSYRVHSTVAQHRHALARALARGVNLIDTSTNYGDGGSEELIGQVLREGITAGNWVREELVVVSKVGYIQGQNLQAAKDRAAKGRPYEEVVKYSDDCWHCIHPDFIDDQLRLSLKRLDLRTLDILLLHNPEYFFMDAVKRKSTDDVEKLQHLFYDRIRRAFACLEGLVAEGVIRGYGVSSNTFVTPTRNLDSTNLAVMWEIAEQIGREKYGDAKRHHFSVVQMPANLLERGAFTEVNNRGSSVIDYARLCDLGVMINRPLNAIETTGMVRLADLWTKSEPIGDWADAVAVAGGHLLNLQKWLAIEAAALNADLRFLSATLMELREVEIRGVDLENWRMWAGSRMLRGFSAWAKDLSDRMSETQLIGFTRLWDQLWTALQKLVKVGDGQIRQRMSEQVGKIRSQFGELAEGQFAEKTMEECAIAALVNTPGVSTVLVGMRAEAYVDSAVGASKISATVNWARY